MVFGLRFATVRPGYAQFFSELLFDRSLSLRVLKRSSSLSCSTRCDSDPVCGGDKRDRTVDLLLAKQALSQLSYTPNYLVVHSGVLPSFISSLKALFRFAFLPSGVGHFCPASLSFTHPSSFPAGRASRLSLEGPSKLNNVLKCFLVMPDLGFRSVLQPIVSP